MDSRAILALNSIRCDTLKKLKSVDQGRVNPNQKSVSNGYTGPFIYQKDPKYRKDPEIPERPVNGSIHARVSGGRGSGRFILILKNALMSLFEYSYNKKNY